MNESAEISPYYIREFKLSFLFRKTNTMLAVNKVTVICDHR